MLLLKLVPLAAVATLGLVLTCPGGHILAADITSRHAELRANYSAQLAELAAWAESQQLSVEAETSRNWLPALQPNRLMLACRPAAGEVVSKLPETASEWRQRFATLRRGQAEALFALAKAAATSGHASVAFQILPEVIRENPDHEKARAILGYEKYEGRWLTPFEVAKARDGQTWHANFGWLPADHVPRYEAGERLFGTRWVDAEDDQTLRSAPRKGWDIVTEHYNVHSSHSLEEGVRLATRLERLYDAWQQIFAGFTATEPILARRFAGHGAKRSVPMQHKVVYFRSRDEYVRALEKDEPQIGISTGFYLANKREAYFYADEATAGDDSNLYHEATHQLFSEIKHSVRDIGQDANFWIVEGIACYMESLTESDGWHFLGGNDAARLRDAQHRLLVDDYYVPLAELTGYGMERLQRDPNIPMLYSESSGLTYFLMHGERARYRDALIAYLSAIYQGRARPTTLAELCAAKDTVLDAQYRAFLKGLK